MGFTGDFFTPIFVQRYPMLTGFLGPLHQGRKLIPGGGGWEDVMSPE